MLQAIRSKTTGIVVKGLFVILLLSFAVWGIGDYAFLRSGEQVAVKVGDVKITADRLETEYRRELDRLRQRFGQIDPEIARQLGLMDQVVDRMINDALFAQEAERQHLLVSDDVIRAQIAANPNFHGLGGTFDRNVFQNVLYQNNLTEAQFIDLMRHDLARSAIIESIAAGARAPDILVDRLYRHREERRVGQVVFVPNASVEKVGEPDDAQLKSVYDDNTERFAEPEYRALSVVRVGVEEVAATITPSEEQIREEYEARLPELSVPERRDLEQILFQSEDAAKEAAAKLAAGTSFADVARDAGQTPEQTKLDAIARADLLPDLAEPVFALPEGGITAPIHSPLGWHVIRVAKIQPGKKPTLAEVRERIASDVAHRLAANSAYEAAVKAEEAVAGGEPLEDAAAKAGVKVVKVEAVNERGLTPKGEPEAALKDAPEALQAAFQTPQGQDSQLIETRSGAFFIVRVDSITPPRTKSLDEVRPQLVELWQAEQRSAAARKRAEAIAEKVKKGTSLAEAAGPALKPETTPPVRRDGSGEKTVASEVAAQLFALKPGETAVTPGRDGHYVVVLKEVRPTDPATDPDGVARLREQISEQIGNDLVQEYLAALRARYGVTIDHAVIDRLLTG